MSEVEEMLNTVDEAIEAAKEVNDILGASDNIGETNSESSNGGEVAVQSGADGDPVLTTEQKKKAINLQDLIYIKKYIQNMAASLKSEVANDVETAYLKKTDAETTYLKKTDATVGATKLADSNGTMKLDASSTDDYILPTVGNNNAAKIILGNSTHKLKEIYSESFKGKADKAILLGAESLRIPLSSQTDDGITMSYQDAKMLNGGVFVATYIKTPDGYPTGGRDNHMPFGAFYYYGSGTVRLQIDDGVGGYYRLNITRYGIADPNFIIKVTESTSSTDAILTDGVLSIYRLSE